MLAMRSESAETDDRSMAMGTVIYEISTSVDGFTTADDPTMDEPMGVGGQQLFAWTSGDNDEQGHQLLVASGQRTGASIAGRRTYDTSIAWWQADGPGGDLRTPTFIVSHTVPDDIPDGSVYTFVGSPLEALEAARAVAGDRSVDVFSASIGNQLLQAGAVDMRSTSMSRRCCSGPGTPLFESLPRHVQLEQLGVEQTAKATYLRYRVASV
jgi:dihydrofolate reductase